MMNQLWDIRYKTHHQATAPLRVLPMAPQSLSSYLTSGSPSPRPKCIYIHVPFCSHICSFCNMQRTHCVPPSDYAKLVARQVRQLSALPQIRQGTFDAVYFGGGTPTTLAHQDLSMILDALKTHLNISPDAEISVESSLHDLTEEKLEALYKGGVNRLSLGVQTFCDRGRKVLGRRGTGEEAARRILRIIDSGFLNTNIDLIYHYPDQSLLELETDLSYIRQLPVAGVSYYALILHEESALQRRLGTDDRAYAKAGLEKEYAHWSRIWNDLAQAGFSAMELTKLVRPGRDAYRYIHIRHAGGDTLPLGAGAAGRIGNLFLHHPMDLALFEQLALSEDPGAYQGREAGDDYDTACRQIGKLQLGWLDAEQNGAYPFLHRLFDRLSALLVENNLAGIQEGRLLLNRDGIFWGNNIGAQYAAWFVEALKQQKG